jgi:HEAT repeat protein
MATKGLREIGDSDAIDPMIILLKDDNRYVRMMAARALSAIGGKKVHDALKKALKAETDEKVKEAITEAMQ